MLADIQQACQFLLLNSYPNAMKNQEYLNDRLSPAIQEQWGFGYFPPLRDLTCLKDLVGQEELMNNGLLWCKNVEDSLMPRSIWKNYFEEHQLIMPFKDAYGKIVALVGRTLLEEAERKEKKIVKYKNTIFHKGNYLFGLFENKQSILEKSCAYIVEGQFDVIKASEIGLTNIIALGNSNITAYQFATILRYTNNLFLLLDNDEAGEKGRERIMKKFDQFANIRNFYVPSEYKDIDQYISEGGIGDWTDMSFVERG